MSIAEPRPGGRPWSRQYRLISGDSHINEPGDLWTSRVTGKYADRVPRIQHFPEGDAWVCDGVDEPITFMYETVAGMDSADTKEWLADSERPRAGWDPAARVEALDRDHVDAEVLYPGGRIQRAVTGQKDPDLHLVLTQTYNDFISEFASYAPDRFAALPLIPNRGVKDAVKEIERIKDMPGVRGVLLGCYPHGSTTISDEDDAVWEVLEDSGLSINIHIGLSNSLPALIKSRLPGTAHFFDAPNRTLEMVCSGIFDRFPRLQVVIAEVDCGWVPYWEHICDDEYYRHERGRIKELGIHLDGLPSEYMRRHFCFGFITDPYGIQNRHTIGVERMMWGSDYPHITSDWPASWKTINSTFFGLDPTERDLILAGNARRVYGFEN